MIFWNVAGVKNKDKEFWEYLKWYDIIGLTETWLEEKDWMNFKDVLPKGWKWEYMSTEREYVKGRAKGGIIFGVKNELKENMECKYREGLIAKN